MSSIKFDNIFDVVTDDLEEANELLMTCLFRLGYRFTPSYDNHQFTMGVEPSSSLQLSISQ